MDGPQQIHSGPEVGRTLHVPATSRGLLSARTSRRPSPTYTAPGGQRTNPTEEIPMQKRAAAVTFKDNPMTLVGPQLKPGDPAPDFKAANSAATTVSLKDTPARARMFSVVPSLDTPVCS